MPPRVQPGEGIVVVMDVGPGVRAGVDATFFSQSKKCLINILQRKMFAEKCRDLVGIVLFGTNGTNNNLASADQYQHITVLRELRTVDWELINEVENLPYGNSTGDWVDALVVGMDLLHDPDGGRFTSKKIVLLTDFSGEFSDDQTSKIITGLKNQGIELNVIGPDIIDDEEEDEDEDKPGPCSGVKSTHNGKIPVTQNWNGKPKTAVQLAGETLVTRLVAELIVSGEEEVLLLQEEIRRLKVHLNGSGRECEVAGVVGNETSSSEVQSVSRCEEAVVGEVATATSSEVQPSTCYKWRVVHSNGRRIRVDGIICSFDEAIAQLIFFQKSSASSGAWNTLLEIGPDFRIAITGRIKVKHVTVPTWKKRHAHDESAMIISETSYHRNDDAQTAVNSDEVIPGYKYGTTLVPFSDEDAQMQYHSNSPRSLSVLGFTKSCNVSHQRRAGDQVLVITAQEGHEAAAVALSSLIQALEELDMVAITRRIYNKNSNPTMGVLFPDITTNYECLIWIPLPYQEDVRVYTFPPLQHIIEKLNDSEIQIMDDLISSMDLTCQEEDDEEVLAPVGVLNPQLQHYFNTLTHRALHPNDPIPPPATHVLNILETPMSVCEARDKVASSLKTLFPTKKIVKAKRDSKDLFASTDGKSNKKSKKDGNETMSASDLTRSLVTHVTTATPVKDFLALLGGEAPDFNLICKQLADVVLQLIDGLGSGGGSNAAMMTKVIDCLTTFRQESCSIDPSTYNKFLSSLKEVVTSMSLSDLWDHVKESRLGMINSEENARSSVDRAAAEEFLKLEQQSQQPAPAPQVQNDDVEDLLDDM
ncbi:X-ray repair cross-complementing protein 5 isoform X2 [Cherax quadricarinatus]|uniref:X-ray repair cross-complementing protein 5 isoform X2 n=1 Tax=Cherax quadricarinatus TaxID=27406 RepID=UPI00387E8AB1